ncbi:MerR family transcriptional regulator [Paenactinomyces guangxiensis]|uniref:MerR family transcriptional regulator n=1 Tax=Paenactinomyces guangxiensis TaxID=1490290 RepID=A0A7W1WPK1_9BACL|nr:MerR family transcriptional regulator [Paenactinomyces guangxiensis]MBA4493707.1 MerR family transcriptional regulator [Paenactinomyces guangxiensis]MBH8590994.1 MerR family transcriptional regulator [Paenactinomyces guangxiensis]
MNQAAYITTREAAERLQVHARTVRKWIDTFEEYICPDWNERGHYVLTEDSLLRLAEIKNRLQEPSKSMKQVREDLMREGKLRGDQAFQKSEEENSNDTAKTLTYLIESMENVGDMMEELFDRMERLEDHMFSLFDSFEDMEQKLIAVNYDKVSSNEVQQMFEDIRKKQDQLRIELRNVNFTQRLTSATSEQGLLPRRQKKARFFGMF